MFATLVNGLAVILGGALGLFFRRGIPERISSGLMTALGLCVLYIGLRGLTDGNLTLVLLIALVLGVLIGSMLDLDSRMNHLGEKMQARFARKGGDTRFAEGFVSASLLFCVGAMAVVGSLDAGLRGDGTTILTKSAIDGVTSIVLASQLGIGVLFSALPILLYQGAITLLAMWVAPILTDPVIAEMNCCGSLLIVVIGLNMIGVTKIKVMNFVPAIFLAGLFAAFWGIYGG